MFFPNATQPLSHVPSFTNVKLTGMKAGIIFLPIINNSDEGKNTKEKRN